MGTEPRDFGSCPHAEELAEISKEWSATAEHNGKLLAENIALRSFAERVVPVLEAVGAWMTGGTEAEIYAQKEALAAAFEVFDAAESQTGGTDGN
jgi:hypothetical protein